MRTILITLLLIGLVSIVTGSAQAINKIVGVDIRTANNYWENYSQEGKVQYLKEIKVAIRRNVANFSLLEYSFVLDQLLPLLKSDTIQTAWANYLAKMDKGDLLVSMSAEFLRSCIEINSYLKKDYPPEYEYVKKQIEKFPSKKLNSERLDSLISAKGFSDLVGEGKIFDILVIHPFLVLNVVAANATLKIQYNTWLNNLSDLAFAYWYSDDRPTEMFVREVQSLIQKLQNSKASLAQRTATSVDKIDIVRIHPNKNGYPLGYVDDPTDKDLLTGMWFGDYTEVKKIFFEIEEVRGKKILGRTKMQGQSDLQFVPFEGEYSEEGKTFKLKLKEPETNSSSNGFFEVVINRFSLEMQGVWTSYNHAITRKFQIKKNPIAHERR